jgi:hypothetical protein
MDDNLNYFIKRDFILRFRSKRTILKNDLSKYLLNLLHSIFINFLLSLYNTFLKKDNDFKYTISVCCMFKNESMFLDEWIKYHLVIGIDHFYLYNNNSDDNFLEILKPYIESNIVELIDWPFENSQMKAYEDCYNKNKLNTNWLTFIDIDEFICPLSSDNIKSWLRLYSKYPGVAVYWKQFGSNGRLAHDKDKYVIEQYTQCWPKHSTLTKMFCNMNFEIKSFSSPHLISSYLFGFKIPPINQYFKLISLDVHRISKMKNSIQINHYWGKAWDCFVENKLNRSDVYYPDSKEMSELRLKLLKSHEAMCTVRDFTIHRFLLYTKLR